MIVRISGEDQYRLDDGDCERLNELEGAVVASVEAGSEDGFREPSHAAGLRARHRRAAPGDDDLEGSDVILPPADISFTRRAREFTGEGLIPD